MKSKENKSIGFQIKAIELLDYALNAPNQPLQNNPVFQYDIQLQQRISNEKNLVIVVCEVSIFNESKNYNYGKIKASCVYEVPELNSFVDNVTKHVSFPEEFITTLNSVSISTTRGIAFSMFRGTFLHNAVLPIIDPSAFKKSLD
jgi:hypothetical protein